MTIKEYATSRAISYEAVAKQVRQYKKKELKKHIKYQGRTAQLDDYAVDFLDQHRQQRTVVVTASNEDTQKELERLHNQVHQLQTELQRKTERINELLEEKTLLIEDKTKKEILEKDNQELKQELKTSQQEIESTKQELGKYQRTIFGLYKKVD